jgi:hypothetical protein
MAQNSQLLSKTLNLQIKLSVLSVKQSLGSVQACKWLRFASVAGHNEPSKEHVLVKQALNTEHKPLQLSRPVFLYGLVFQHSALFFTSLAEIFRT